MKKLRALCASVVSAWDRRDAAGRIRWVLGAVIGVIAIVLLFAKKPWDVGLAEMDDPRVRDYVAVWSWWAGIFVMAGLAFLASVARWWMRPLPLAAEPRQPETRATPKGFSKWFWPLVAGAMLVTAVMGAQRLDFSLWDDEEFSVRRFIQGSYSLQDDGSVRWRDMRWRWTLANYESPNNHILHSVLARLSGDTWSLFAGSDAVPFSARAIRVPAFVFGILSLASLAWLFREWGLARAGVLAAWVYALHPWHLRYASEARGYSLVLFLLPLLLVCWTRALREGAWRWWIAFGGCGLALALSNPVTVYPLIALNVVTPLFLVTRHPSGLPPAVPLGRWFAVNAFAGLAFIQIFAPCVPQFLRYLETPVTQGAMGAWWIRNFFAYLYAGMSWDKSKDPSAPQPELFTQALAHPWFFQTMILLAVALVAVGLFRIAFKGWIPATGAAVLIVPAWAVYLIAARSGNFLFEWYLVFVLPGAAAAFAAGWDAFCTAAGRLGKAGIVAVLCAFAVYMGGYWNMTHEARDWLLTRSIQPSKESALLARGTIEPNYDGADEILTASFSAPAYLYDPHLHRVRSVDEIMALAEEAERSGRPFYLNIGNPWAASFGARDMFMLMTESGLFETIEHFYGYDPTLDRIVARYRPGSVEGFDLGRFLAESDD